ncbi:helix-hairpin-helix domain-containing protein, partial [Candidatus Omnitrophota bacterium]
DQALVKDFAGIYFLKKEDLLKLDLFKEKRAENLLAAIEKSKKQPLSRLIFGLGVRHVGEKAAFVLAQKFGSLDKLVEAGRDELVAIDAVGEVMADSIVKFFRQKSTAKLLARLKEVGLNLKQGALELKKSALTGKTAVFTGELEELSRDQAEELVRSHGGNATSSVSKSTDFVVAGRSPGSKYDKARKLGIKIINEKQFLEMTK